MMMTLRESPGCLACPSVGFCSVGRGHRGERNAMTLLEVLLSLLVLMVAISGISGLIMMGSYSAADAKDLTMAQVLCESKMSEVASGVSEAASSSGGFPNEPDWTFTVETSPAGTPGLLSVRVTVQQDRNQIENPIEFSLVRWMPDPNFDVEAAE